MLLPQTTTKSPDPFTAPAELLTQSNAILGQGQMSLAKYLLIVNRADDPQLEIADIGAFLRHVLQRADWRRDLHFQTRTTIDTLDYSGSGLNHGSKLVIAAAGDPIRELGASLNADIPLSAGFTDPRVCTAGVLAVRGPAYAPGNTGTDSSAELFCSDCRGVEALRLFPLVVIVDDSGFVAQSLSNFLWVVFTRSNPSADVYGIDSFVENKHWGCRGSLVIDARIKPHHAPPLEEDPAITKRVDVRAARGGPLARYL